MAPWGCGRVPCWGGVEDPAVWGPLRAVEQGIEGGVLQHSAHTLLTSTPVSV